MRVLALYMVVSMGCQAFAADPDGETEVLHWQHGLSFFGGFKYPPGFDHFDYVNPDAPKGGKLVRALGASFNSFTPFISKGMIAPGLIDVIVEPTLYDSLMRPSLDEIATYYGNLAEQMAVSNDKTTLWVKLRPEARWHDGQPVTARDVKFTFDHVRGGYYRSTLSSLKRVDVIEERQVRFTFNYPVNNITMMMLGRFAILPEHYWRERDITETTTEPPLSSGPYRIGKFEIGKFIEFERVDDYWGKDFGLHKGSFNINVLRYEVYRDATIAREALNKGLLDAFNEPSAQLWVTGYDPSAGLLTQLQLRYQQFVGVASALAFNQKLERFQDVRVREALFLAFDFDWMNDTFDYGVYEKPQSFFHGTFMAATGLPSAKELELLAPLRGQIPPRVFTEAPFAGSANAGLTRREALIRAQSLLAEAGWHFAGNQLVNDKGETFEIEFLVTSARDQRTRLPYIEQLKRLGIAARVRMLESAQLINLRRAHKVDAVAGSLTMGMPPGIEVPTYLASTSRGPENFAHLDSPVVDTLIDHLSTASTRDEFTTAGRALDRVLYWQFYFIPMRLVAGPRIVVWNKYAQPDGQSRDFIGFPATWWWDPTKAQRIGESLSGR